MCGRVAGTYFIYMLMQGEHVYATVYKSRVPSAVSEAAELEEEVHAVVRGELELIKKLGKEWFTTPSPDVPPEQLLRFSMKAGE